MSIFSENLGVIITGITGASGGTYTDDEIGEEVYSPNIPDS